MTGMNTHTEKTRKLGQMDPERENECKLEKLQTQPINTGSFFSLISISCGDERKRKGDAEREPELDRETVIKEVKKKKKKNPNPGERQRFQLICIYNEE